MLIMASPSQAADADSGVGGIVAIKTPFFDIPATNANAIYIKLLSQRGIITGYPDGGFHPNEGLNRAQAATVIVKAAGLTIDPKSKAPFNDIGDGYWAKNYIAAATKAGYIKGIGNGSFIPKNNSAAPRASALS